MCVCLCVRERASLLMDRCAEDKRKDVHLFVDDTVRPQRDEDDNDDGGGSSGDE